MNVAVAPTHTPANEAEAGEIVRAARARRAKLDIVGGGTRAGLGRPREGAERLSTAGLAGLVFYEPSEMTICARAGTPLAVVEKALADNGQMLPFEPIDHRALYASGGEPTVGGLVATNASGPRRVSAGAARDSLIGVRLVNGRGECVKSGGRVMKNVAGLDLVKLTCGAHGTLGLVTEATFKALPRPKAEATLVLHGLNDEGALAAMTRALGSPYGVSGAATLEPGMGGESRRAILRVEGVAESVDYRLDRLVALLAEFAAEPALRGEASRRLWRATRDAEFLAEPRDRAIWRVNLAPSQGPRFVADFGARALSRFSDWGGGLIWLACEPTVEVAAALREALAPHGGHATLARAPDDLRARLDVFEQPSPTLARLTRGLKASFDPDGVINFGRMYAGV